MLPETPLVEESLGERSEHGWQPGTGPPEHPVAVHHGAGPTPVRRALPPRRPVSARQRAIYRRRRIAAAVLLLVLTILLALAIQGLTALVSTLASPAGAAADPAPVAAADDPVQLAVPAGGSALPLSPAGVDGRGVIDPPAGEAVWYTGHDRVTPGDLGTAVIVGHAAGEDGAPTSFADVTSLEAGDRVVVTFGDGVTLELDVVSAALVERRELESSDLLWGSQTETRRVALVTADEVTGDDGDARGVFLAVAELG